MNDQMNCAVVKIDEMSGSVVPGENKGISLLLCLRPKIERNN